MTEVLQEPYPVWQGLFDNAPDKEDRTELEDKACLLAELNYQTCNGGFPQWVDNGYGVRWQDTVDVLKEVGTKNAMKAIALIETFAEFIDDSKENRGCFGDYWLTETDTCYEICYDEENDEEYEEEYEEEYNPGWDYADKASSKYYEFNEALEAEIEAFLANGGKPNENPTEAITEASKANRKPIIRGPIDGNAFSILGVVQNALKKDTDMSNDEIEEIMKEAMSGDYNHLLQTCMKHVEFKI